MNKKVRYDLTGQKFNRLTVISIADDYISSSQNSKPIMWNCVCECGNKTIVSTAALRSGHTKSCGCLQKEKARIIGKTQGKKRSENKFDFSEPNYIVAFDNQGRSFMFDYDDLEKVKTHYWYVSSKGYVVSHIFNDGNRKQIQLHRYLMNNPNGIIDHINRNPLDNRKQNLRLATNSQNQMNVGIRINNKSGVSGVNFDKRANNWRSRITVNNKRICLGSFDNFIDAVKARKDAEVKYYGEYRYKEASNE